MADVLTRLFPDQAEMTRQDWLAAPVVHELAELMVLGRYKAFHLGVTNNTVPESSILSMGALDGDGPNWPPFAGGDSYITGHDYPIYDPAPGVLRNDEDWDYDPLQAVLVTGPSFAANFSLASDGAVSYAPQEDWAGSDFFTYKAFDGRDYSEEVTVSITVWNYPPTAEPDSYAVLHDRTLEVSAAAGVLSNDADWDCDFFWATLGTGPSHAAQFSLRSDGSFTYVPEEHYVGVDTFTYYADDGVVGPMGGPTGPVEVTIVVMNRAPIAAADIFYPSFEQPDQPVRLPVLTEGVVEDPDEDGDDVIITQVTQPTNGGEAWIAEDAKSIWYRLPAVPGSSFTFDDRFVAFEERPQSTDPVGAIPEGAGFDGLVDEFYYTISDTLETSQALVQVAAAPRETWTTKYKSGAETARDGAMGFEIVIEQVLGEGSVGKVKAHKEVWQKNTISSNLLSVDYNDVASYDFIPTITCDSAHFEEGEPLPITGEDTLGYDVNHELVQFAPFVDYHSYHHLGLNMDGFTITEKANKKPSDQELAALDNLMQAPFWDGPTHYLYVNKPFVEELHRRGDISDAQLNDMKRIVSERVPFVLPLRWDTLPDHYELYQIEGLLTLESPR